MDINTIQAVLTKVAVLAPVTTGLVQVVKVSGLPSRFLPLAALAIGAIFGYVFVAASSLGVLAGLVLGLSAVGLFEFGKTTIAGQ